MTAQEFIFDTPLYSTVTIKDGDNFIKDISYKGGKVEGYNSIQKKESTFLIIKGLCDLFDGFGIAEDIKLPLTSFKKFGQYLLKNSSANTIICRCERYVDLFYTYVYWNAERNEITKIGQYPSMADLHIGQIKQYKKVLSKEKMKEFTRAIGLAANGVGIGSFVYLRRIFESLIFEIAQDAIQSGKLDQKLFTQARMDKKIEYLKEDLPIFLIENKNIYGILSKGIHELSEKDCLEYFDVLRTSIELILDEHLVACQKIEKMEKASKALNSISSKITADASK